MRDIIYNRRYVGELVTDTMVVLDDELHDKLTISIDTETNGDGVDIRHAAYHLSERDVKALHGALGNWLKNKRLERAMRNEGGV